MKVVFISHDPLTINIKENFFLDQYIRDGIDVEYLCVRPIVQYSKSRHLVNEIRTDYSKEITSLKEFKATLSAQPPNTFFCLELWFNWDTYSIFKLLKPYQDRLFSVDWYINIPRTSMMKKLRDDLRGGNIRRLTDILIRKIKNQLFSLWVKMNEIKQPHLLFAPGAKSLEISADREIVVLHHHDYTVYKELGQNTTPVVTGKYAVFLDNMLPYHPDFSREKNKSVNPQTYFKALNNLFDRIEKEQGVKVVIAAHPKSSYSNEFNGREVIKYRTNALVKNASLVIAHHSTSINFAVLNKKPILLVYSNEFIANRKEYLILKNIYYAIILYREELNTGLVNIDEMEKLDIQPVDNAKYDRFIRDYITNGDPRSNYEIIKSRLEAKQESKSA